MVATLAALIAVPVYAQYELWYSIDCGGATFSANGGFELGGTIGQPDAGTAVGLMSGGEFQLMGGFWGGGATACALPGDLNLDAIRNGLDIQGFIQCLLGPGSNCACADLDNNGSVTASDINPMVTLLLGS
jgi:hypothetical protein